MELFLFLIVFCIIILYTAFGKENPVYVERPESKPADPIHLFAIVLIFGIVIAMILMFIIGITYDL